MIIQIGAMISDAQSYVQAADLADTDTEAENVLYAAKVFMNHLAEVVISANIQAAMESVGVKEPMFKISVSSVGGSISGSADATTVN